MQLGEYVEDHQETITNALRVYAEYMNASAIQAQQAFEAGQADPSVLAEQNSSMVTNSGFGGMAKLFRENADRAMKAAAEIDRLIDGEEDE